MRISESAVIGAFLLAVALITAAGWLCLKASDDEMGDEINFDDLKRKERK